MFGVLGGGTGAGGAGAVRAGASQVRPDLASVRTRASGKGHQVRF